MEPSYGIKKVHGKSRTRIPCFFHNRLWTFHQTRILQKKNYKWHVSKTFRNVTHVWLNCFIFCFSFDEKHKNRSNKHRLETVVSILKWRKNNIVCMHSFVGNRRFSSFKRRENNTIPLRAWNNEIASHCCRSILKRANLKSIAMLHFIQKTLTSIRFLSLSSKANNVFLFPLFCFASQSFPSYTHAPAFYIILLLWFI